MRKLAIILSLLANLSLLLMPFATAHAHIDSFAASSSAEFHGGHHHDFDHDGDAEQSHGNVVDLTDSYRAQPKPDQTFWSDWLPLACLIALAVYISQLCTLVLIPPRSDPKPVSRTGYWRPPLRGPPAFSIQ